MFLNNAMYFAERWKMYHFWLIFRQNAVRRSKYLSKYYKPFGMRMVLRICNYTCAHSFHSCVMASSLFINFPSQSKCYLDIEYNEIGLIS